MENINAPDSRKVMGRPPLHVTALTVRLRTTSLTKIKELVGEKGVSEFVRDAVDREIERRELDADKA